MNQKKIIKNNKVILLIKNNESNWNPPSTQTAHLRKVTNDKIRKLGNKYYEVKALFEKLKLNRDFIYEMGRRFVEEYKTEKKGLSLQTQQRRMKESLLVWYTENFYEEIFNPDASFIKKLINKDDNQIKTQRLQIKTKPVHEENNDKKFFDDILYNKEIDGFELSNLDDKNTEVNYSKNFNFDSLLLFNEIK